MADRCALPSGSSCRFVAAWTSRRNKVSSRLWIQPQPFYVGPRESNAVAPCVLRLSGRILLVCTRGKGDQLQGDAFGSQVCCHRQPIVTESQAFYLFAKIRAQSPGGHPPRIRRVKPQAACGIARRHAQSTIGRAESRDYQAIRCFLPMSYQMLPVLASMPYIGAPVGLPDQGVVSVTKQDVAKIFVGFRRCFDSFARFPDARRIFLPELDSVWRVGHGQLPGTAQCGLQVNGAIAWCCRCYTGVHSEQLLQAMLFIGQWRYCVVLSVLCRCSQ